MLQTCWKKTIPLSHHDPPQPQLGPAGVRLKSSDFWWGSSLRGDRQIMRCFNVWIVASSCSSKSDNIRQHTTTMYLFDTKLVQVCLGDKVWRMICCWNLEEVPGFWHAFDLEFCPTRPVAPNQCLPCPGWTQKVVAAGIFPYPGHGKS